MSPKDHTWNARIALPIHFSESRGTSTDTILKKSAMQVMEEGEKLSKKQLTQETTIRKLRGQVKEMEAEQSKASIAINLLTRRVQSYTCRLKTWNCGPLSGLDISD